MGLAVMLDFVNKNVLVVGGGKIGLRKSKALAEANANIFCISKSFCQGFDQLIRDYPDIHQKQKLFEEADLDTMDFVVAATDDERLNQNIYDLCNRRHIWCLTTDKKSDSSVSFMATNRIEHLTIAISTDGQSPGFAKKYLQKISAAVQEEDLDELKRMAETRKKRLKDN